MKTLFSIFFCLASGLLIGQNTRFYVATEAAVLDAKTRKYQALQNSQFQVSFTLENGKGTGFKPPKITGLAVIQGPMNSSEISIVNGKRSEKKSYIYTLAATKSGTFRIGAASITTSKGILKTTPFTIVVSPRSQTAVDNGGETYVDVELNDTSTYIGQQIILELKLYTTENIKSYDALTDFNFDGFYVRELNEYSRRSQRIIKNGKEYFTTVLKAVALFPQQTGSYEIPSFSVRVGIPKQSRRRSIFSFQEYDYKVVSTDVKTIEVDDVPLGAPLSFSGGVGKYRAVFKIDKRSVSTDDNLTLLMDIRGNGDSKKVLSPMMDLGENFEVYEPNLLRDEEYVDQGNVINYKSYEFLIVPKKAGTFTLNPEFTYFNTDSNDYVTLNHSRGFRIKAIQGKKIDADLNSIANRNLAPNISSTLTISPSYGFMGSVGYIGLMSLIGLGILGMIGHQQYLKKMANQDQALVNRKKANKVAIQRLKLAERFMNNKDERGFYDELTKALIKYVEDKLTIATGSLPKEELIALLQEKGVPESASDKVLDLLKKSEISLFAGGKTGQMEEMYNASLDIISQIEEMD